MSDRKDDATGELDDGHLADVSGGVGGAGAAGLMEEEGIAAARGKASGKPQISEIVISKTLDKSTP